MREPGYWGRLSFMFFLTFCICFLCWVISRLGA